MCNARPEIQIEEKNLSKLFFYLHKGEFENTISFLSSLKEEKYFEEYRKTHSIVPHWELLGPSSSFLSSSSSSSSSFLSPSSSSPSPSPSPSSSSSPVSSSDSSSFSGLVKWPGMRGGHQMALDYTVFFFFYYYDYYYYFSFLSFLQFLFSFFFY